MCHPHKKYFQLGSGLKDLRPAKLAQALRFSVQGLRLGR
jgi:hypothetical protein